MWACSVIVFASLANGLTACAMNVVATCTANAALWQGHIVPRQIVMEDFAAYAAFIVTRVGKLKGNTAHVALGIAIVHRRREIVFQIVFVKAASPPFLGGVIVHGGLRGFVWAENGIGDHNGRNG